MSYKIKNGIVYVCYKGVWYLDSVLFSIWPELRGAKLTAYSS